MSFLFKNKKGKDGSAKKKKKSTDDKDSKESQVDKVTRLRAFFEKGKQAIDFFKMQDTLGTGTFGRVRLVSCKINNQSYCFACKMLKKTVIVRLQQVEHIKSEKKILMLITHPFIVNLYYAFKDELMLYMVMEYVHGGELFSQLRKVGRFNNNTSRFYAGEILLALAYLHKKNIVYRDLKPENLLIDRQGHIKITDFGFAKILEDQSCQRTWTLCGTPEYLAPEIIQSQGHGFPVDWWALGILMFEMLAGYPPFYDDVAFNIYEKILKGKIEFPRHMESPARDLVTKLLVADRTKRIGCLHGGAEDIKKHKWFKGVDWKRMEARRSRTPFAPAVSSESDTRHFDDYPDSEEEEEEAVDEEILKQFEDF